MAGWRRPVIFLIALRWLDRIGFAGPAMRLRDDAFAFSHRPVLRQATPGACF
jgi:hypothetical protein